MRKDLGKAAGREMIRYLFFGGCTTVVNVAVFVFLRYEMDFEVQSANLISILAAIIFAFFVNKYFVFCSAGINAGTLIREFSEFAGMRSLTLLIEFWGVAAFAAYMHVSDFASKLVIQVVVIVLNYIISKCYVFKERSV